MFRRENPDGAPQCCSVSVKPRLGKSQVLTRGHFLEQLGTVGLRMVANVIFACSRKRSRNLSHGSSAELKAGWIHH